MTRNFINIKQVIALAQEYTSEKVEVVTVNSQTSVREQIKLFNSIDVLITCHGSHLTNGIFTAFPGLRAVIEVVPYAFDRVFMGNYMQLGFADYILSTGHTQPEKGSDGLYCAIRKTSDFDDWKCKERLQTHPYGKRPLQQFMTCKIEPRELYRSEPQISDVRRCDTLVNLKILRSHLDKLFTDTLCN